MEPICKNKNQCRSSEGELQQKGEISLDSGILSSAFDETSLSYIFYCKTCTHFARFANAALLPTSI